MIEFRLLGPLEVMHDGAPVQLGGRRRRSALAILLLNAGRVVSVDRLADDLYAGAAPATAVTQVQRQVSELRRLLPEARLETVPPGYVLRVQAEQVDLQRFERLVADGVSFLEGDRAEAARDVLHEALGLWRGPPLADLAAEPFAAAATARLEELRLAAHEYRFEADLALGRAGELVPELDELRAAHPLRERLVELLMLALYRAGRQTDALAAYREQRKLLAEELGLEPGPALRQLEAAILRQDPGLTVARDAGAPPTVVAVAVDRPLSPALAELASGDACETILLQLVSCEAGLAVAAAEVEEQRIALPGSVRGTAFVTEDWIDDVVRFAAAYDAALLLVDAPPGVAGALLPVRLLQRASVDVGLVFGGDRAVADADLYVPFGGGEHDWGALEIAAALARARGRGVRLVGTSATTEGRRDASRLLGDAALAVQRAFEVPTAPVLAPGSPDALLAVVEDAALVVAGVGSRWLPDGLDPVRAALVAGARAPVMLVHCGPRPGLLAPRESRTRFTWSAQY